MEVYLPQASEKMNAAKEKTRNLLFDYLDTAASIFLMINKDHSIELINRKGCEILGYSREEILGKDWFKICIPKSEQGQLAEFFDNIIAGIEPPPDIYENWILAKGKKRKLIQWRNSLMRDRSGKVKGLISSGVEITELAENRKKLARYREIFEARVNHRTHDLQEAIKKLVETNLTLEDQIIATRLTENKMQESRRLLSTIVQNFPRGAVLVFNDSLELIFIDGEELARLGLNKADFEGKPLNQISLFSELEHKSMTEYIRSTLQGRPVLDEVCFKGQHYTVRSTALRSERRKTLWTLIVFNNISEQKQLQIKLEKALQTEQELNELKSRFIAMASHEFRTPLSAILSSAILIGKQNGPGKEERRLKHVERIRANVNNLVVILNDFLSLDKLDEGDIKVVAKPFELLEFSRLILEEMESTKKLGQQLYLSHKHSDITVYLDPKLLSHILMNLLSNAIKYSGEGQAIHLYISRNDWEVMIAVRDEGIGIPLGEQKHLFERFFRATNATNIQGTGLGLHIVKNYTQLMGGEIGFESAPGKGTTITLRFPINFKTYEKDPAD